MKKNNILIFLCVLLFAGVGIYLLFFAGNTSKYDSQIKAYRIDENEQYDSDGYMYYPIYYYKVGEKEYSCEAKSGSSSVPSKKKNVVYYDSKNPEKCLTEYDKSSGKLGGIICIIASILILFFMFKKPSTNSMGTNQVQELDYEKQRQLTENIQKAEEFAGKVQLAVKRVILAFVILILFVLSLFDFLLFKQTIAAKDYIDTTATLVEEKESADSEMLNDYIYTFKDKSGNDQKITISDFKDNPVNEKIKIKYNEKNPQDFYEATQVLDKKGIIWFIVKIILLILSIILLFNKNLLSKINLSIGRH